MSLDMIKEVDDYDLATRSYLTNVGEALNGVSSELKAPHPVIP